jgi:chromosome segregation ATPase
MIASAFVVWCDHVREKRLASIVKDAEGERVALTEAEARAQASLSEREFRIGLLESQLASREQLLQQQEADLDGARSRAQFLEGQLAGTIQELRTANAERQAVQAAVSERGLQVQELADAARETSRLKAENELLAEGLESHASKERELALKVDEIENALLEEQATHARLQLQYEAQLRVGAIPLHSTAHVSSPEDPSGQFVSPGSAHGSGEVSRIEVEFHELSQRTATHVSSSVPRNETQRLTQRARNASSGRSERTELFI